MTTKNIAFVQNLEIPYSPWSRTFAAIADTDAIKTSIASAASIQTYITAALNGVYGVAVFPLPHLVTVTNTSSVGSYVAAAITISGEDADGNTITDTLTLTTANGNETITSVRAFAKVTSIVVPAQVNTSGAFQFGVGDIVLPYPVRVIRAGSANALKVGYDDGSTDTVTLLAGERHTALVKRIYSSETTALPITVYA